MSLRSNSPFNSNRFYQNDDITSGTKELDANTVADIFNTEDDDVNEDDEIDLNRKPKKQDENKDIKDEDDKDDEKKDKKSDENKNENKDDSENEDENEQEDELSELEDELEDDIDVDEDDDDIDIGSRPSRKTILAKYPNFFKEFPGVEKAYFREQKFSEIYPSIKDAQVASEKAKTLDNFEQELLKGNTTNVLDAVKKEDQNAFNRLVDNYLPSLRQIDEKAYFHVTGTIVKGIIYNMVKNGREENNEELQEAARVLNQFVFNSTKYVPPTKLAKDDDNKSNPEAEKLAKERQEFEQQRFQTAHQSISNRVNTLFTKVIEKSIDPKSTMTPYIKNNAMRDAHESLDKLLDKDARFKAVLTKAWEKARESNYNEESMDRLMKVIKNRAGALLPQVIKKARIEALKGMGKRVRETVDDNDTDNNTESGDTTSSQNRGPLKKKENNNTRQSNSKNDKDGPKKGQSLRDYMMAD